MGTYNTLHTSMASPRCGAVGDVEVELRVGNTAQMRNLVVGDQYPWVSRAQPQNGGRPEQGSVDGDGYMECEFCHADSFIRVIIREDVIVGVEPDMIRQGQIPD
jgi:hypothetical protein